MEFTMKSIIKSSFFAACVAASAVEASATEERCPILDEIVVEGTALLLPADVAQQLTALQSHGDRYARVIDLIIAENAKPDWAFTIECIAAVDATSTLRSSMLAMPSSAQFAHSPLPASSKEADDQLALLFDADRIQRASPESLRRWYSSVILDPMTSDTMHLASAAGIDAVMEGLLDTDKVRRFSSTLEPGTAQPFFAVLFHPAFLGVLVEEVDARRTSWSLLVDTLEGLYPRGQ